MKHRCFKIPKDKLDLFLTALWVNFTQQDFAPQAKWVFQNDDVYDVIVGFNKEWEAMEGSIETFVLQMSS